MTTAATSTVKRRFSQVYVAIPPSPYSRRDSFASRNAVPPSDENMPEDADSQPASYKRKQRDNGDFAGPVAKKAKVNAPAKESHSKSHSNVNEQYPNGYFHCHQCVQKRDARHGLHCTFRGPSRTQGRRCKLKYCRTCLKNRYGLDLDVLKSRHPSTLHGKELVEYVTDVDHVFKCPRCTKMCNCRTCRKAAGLPPTGNLTVTAKRTGADSVAAMLATNKNLTEAQAKQMDLLPAPPAATNTKASSSKTMQQKLVVEITKPKRAYVRKPKPALQPLWSSALVPSSFTLEHGLARIHIHDFVMRFGAFFGDLTKAQQDELSEIGGRGARLDDDEDNEEVDAGVNVGWVSEGCLRGVLLGLLGLAVDAEGVQDDKDTLRAFKSASLGIRNAGASLNKMWTALSETDIEHILSLPDPLPPPSNRGRVTRSDTRAASDVHLVTSAQFVPVVGRLIQVCMGSVGVKEVMDECGSKMADLGRDERERRKEEKERWEAWRKTNTATKTERDAHTQTLSSFTHALTIAQQAHAPRFAPLGTDHCGRTYVLAGPSQSERDMALELLTGEKSKKRARAARYVPSEEERAAMKKWEWFLAVHGEIPKGAKRAVEDEDEDRKRWWGFYDPAEIRKLAGWIAHANGLHEDKGKTKVAASSEEPAPVTVAVAHGKGKAKSSSAASSSRSTASSSLSSAPRSSTSSSSSSKHARDSLTPLSSLESDDEDGHSPLLQRRGATRGELEKLVQGLKEYADLLEWRVSRGEPYVDGVGEKDAKGKGKSGAVRVQSFYG